MSCYAASLSYLEILPHPVISTKEAEKPAKYGPLRWELKQQYPGYEVKQFNVIIDVLGGWSVELEETMKELVGQRSRSVLRRM